MDEDGEKLPFSIVKCSGGSFLGAVTYSTLGLSNRSLESPVSNKEIKHELIFVSYETFGDKNIPSILQQVALLALKNKKIFLRGDVIGPFDPLFDGSQLEALYVTNPSYFPDSFKRYVINDETVIVQAWLIPITAREADFISLNGWSKFESLLEKVDPDLVDFNRKSKKYNLV